MKFAAILTTTACFCLTFAFCDIGTNRYDLIYRNFQFKTHGIIKTFPAVSVSFCTMECLNLKGRCGSFTFSKKKLCTLSVLRLTNEVTDPSLVFDAEKDTKMYGKISGSIK